MMRFIDAALPLAAMGFSVFPLSPGTKLPAISQKAGGKGVKDASTDPGQIRAWARRFPRANVGSGCGRASGVTVIDIDPSHGGNETVAAFREKGLKLTPTILVQTPSGGWHAYYTYEPLLLNSKAKLGPGIDVRNDHGYVVAPPSLLKDGRFYRWVTAPSAMTPARMPRWAMERLRPQPAPAYETTRPARDPDGALKGLLEFLRNAREGERNGSLYWAACRAKENGLTDAGTQQLLIATAVSIGLDPKESHKSVLSGFKAGRRLA